MLTAAEILVLAQSCAPQVAPSTMAAVIGAESRGRPLAIHVNGAMPRAITPRSTAEASATARTLIVKGLSVDLGLGQINSRNLAGLGLSIEDAFDPCRNVAAAARVLTDGYARASASVADPQSALRIALSYYNTGSPKRGMANGYVARIERESLSLPPPSWPPAGPDATPGRNVFGPVSSPNFVFHFASEVLP